VRGGTTGNLRLNLVPSCCSDGECAVFKLNAARTTCSNGVGSPFTGCDQIRCSAADNTCTVYTSTAYTTITTQTSAQMKTNSALQAERTYLIGSSCQYTAPPPIGKTFELIAYDFDTATCNPKDNAGNLLPANEIAEICEGATVNYYLWNYWTAANCASPPNDQPIISLLNLPQTNAQYTINTGFECAATQTVVSDPTIVQDFPSTTPNAQRLTMNYLPNQADWSTLISDETLVARRVSKVTFPKVTLKVPLGVPPNTQTYVFNNENTAVRYETNWYFGKFVSICSAQTMVQPCTELQAVTVSNDAFNNLGDPIFDVSATSSTVGYGADNPRSVDSVDKQQASRAIQFKVIGTTLGYFDVDFTVSAQEGSGSDAANAGRNLLFGGAAPARCPFCRLDEVVPGAPQLCQLDSYRERNEPECCCTGPPPLPPYCGSTMRKDPHLSFPHGGQADMRGEHGKVFNLLSARNVSFNVRTDADDFKWSHRLVHGTKLAAAYWTVRTNTGRVLKIEYHAKKSPLATVHEDGKADVELPSGKLVVDNLSINLNGRALAVTVDKKWKMTAVISPFPFASLNAHKLLLDVGIDALYNADEDMTSPHGIIGQHYDGDNVAVDGKMDDRSGNETTTMAQAQGAIEGDVTDYKMSAPFAVNFKFSRFDKTSAPKRDVSALKGHKTVRMAGAKAGSKAFADDLVEA